MFRKVIISHLGELTHDTRTVGDAIRYRIYYDSLATIGARVIISDKLDPILSRVTAFNGGVYDAHTHTVTWEVTGLFARRRAYVEV
jgi:hypothetical protein